MLTPSLEERVFLNEVVAWLNSQGKEMLVRYQDGETNPAEVPPKLGIAIDSFCKSQAQFVINNEPHAGEDWGLDDDGINITWYFKTDGSVIATSHVLMCSNPIAVIA